MFYITISIGTTTQTGKYYKFDALTQSMALSVYIILCSDKSYYTGVTKDVETRFYQHCSGFDPDCYTYSRRPLQLVWSFEFGTNMEGIWWEKKIKGWSRKKKEALIRGDFNALVELSRCKNSTSSKYSTKIPKRLRTKNDVPEEFQNKRRSSGDIQDF